MFFIWTHSSFESQEKLMRYFFERSSSLSTGVFTTFVLLRKSQSRKKIAMWPNSLRRPNPVAPNVVINCHFFDLVVKSEVKNRDTWHWNQAKKMGTTGYLRIKYPAGLDGIVGIAEDEPLGDVVLLDALQLDTDVLAALDPRHLDVVRPQLKIIQLTYYVWGKMITISRLKKHK